MTGKIFFMFIVFFLLLNVNANAKSAQPNLYQASTTQRSKIAEHISNNNKRQNTNYDPLSSSSSSEFLDNYEYDMFPKLNNRQTSTINKNNNNDRIVYPGSSASSEKCEHGFCTNVPNYPKELIKKILARYPQMENNFKINDTFIDINNRNSDNEIKLCEDRTHFTFPQKANNTMNQEKIIVNVVGKYEQGIRIVTCASTTCNKSEIFLDKYASFCVQKHSRQSLKVLGENHSIIENLFDVPSCCVCMLKKIDSK